jgi:hypothetical protein
LALEWLYQESVRATAARNEEETAMEEEEEEEDNGMDGEERAKKRKTTSTSTSPTIGSPDEEELMDVVKGELGPKAVRLILSTTTCGVCVCVSIGGG